MSKFLKWAIVASIVVGAQGLAWADSSLRIGWQTGDVQVLMSYADKSGLFSAEGLDYSSNPFPAGPAMLPALAANEVDIAWMGEFPAVTGYAQGIPISIFLIEQEWKSHIRLVAQPDSGIESLSDLQGKTVGVTFGSSGHNHMLIALEGADLTADDVTLVNLQPGHMPGAFESEAIDAALTWEPNVATIERAGGVTIATTESIGTTLLGVWVVRQEYLRDHPENIQKFLAAWNKAMEHYAEDPLAVFEAEGERLGQAPEEMAELVERQQGYRPSYQEQLTADFLSVEEGEENRLVRHFTGIAEFMVGLDRIDGVPVDWGPFISTVPLETYLQMSR